MSLFSRKPQPPNPIDTIVVPGYVGAIGLVACPGVRVMQPDPGAPKFLEPDLQELADWGANGVVSLIEEKEFRLNNCVELPRRIGEAGMWWLHLPIVDMDIPDQNFEDVWAYDGARIRHALRIGERVILHCYAGLGRTGMIAARILVEMGMDPEMAIKTVRRANSRRIQTKRQSAFVRTCIPLADG